MSSIRPKYGKEEEDIIDVEPEGSEHNEVGDWNDILKEQQNAEELKANLEAGLMQNVQLTSTPQYNAALTILLGLCSNSAPKFINMEPNSKINLAITMADTFIEEIINEINK